MFLILYWSSKFSDVFDEDHFINALSKDIRVIKKLPKGIDGLTKVVKHFKSYSGLRYYQNEIATMWDEYKVIIIFLNYLFLCTLRTCYAL